MLCLMIPVICRKSSPWAEMSPIRRGLSSKEIANLLNISLFTVGRHRHNIRKK